MSSSWLGIFKFIQWNLDLTEPRFNEVLDLTNNFLGPGQSYCSKMYGTQPRYNEPSIWRTNLAGPAATSLNRGSTVYEFFYSIKGGFIFLLLNSFSCLPADAYFTILTWKAHVRTSTFPVHKFSVQSSPLKIYITLIFKVSKIMASCSHMVRSVAQLLSIANRFLTDKT